MEKYEPMEIEVIEFDTIDVVTLSDTETPEETIG